MTRPLIAGAVLAAVAAVGVSRVQHLESQVESLRADAQEAAPAVPEHLLARLTDLGAGVHAALCELGELRREMEAESATLRRERTAVLATPAQELARLQAELGGLRAEFADLSRQSQQRAAEQTAALTAVDAVRTEVQAEVADALAALRTEEEQRWNGLSEAVSAASHRVEHFGGQVADLGAQVGVTDPETRWRTMVGPTVRLEGVSTVGSGVVLASHPHPDGRGHRTLVLTAWHVVRDIQADAIGPDKLIPVELHLPDRSRHELASLVGHNVALDAALLELRSRDAVPFGARLASRSTLARSRVFGEVYAVGCPLGNEPIPTRGEIADTDHALDGTRYWMISAPTYIGNSGGGIFDGERQVLLALFSKIYTHGTIRPTVIPHMGLASPLDAVYDWLEADGIARVVPDADGLAVHLELPAPASQAVADLHPGD